MFLGAFDLVDVGDDDDVISAVNAAVMLEHVELIFVSAFAQCMRTLGKTCSRVAHHRHYDNRAVEFVTEFQISSRTRCIAMGIVNDD